MLPVSCGNPLSSDSLPSKTYPIEETAPVAWFCNGGVLEGRPHHWVLRGEATHYLLVSSHIRWNAKIWVWGRTVAHLTFEEPAWLSQRTHGTPRRQLWLPLTLRTRIFGVYNMGASTFQVVQIQFPHLPAEGLWASHHTTLWAPVASPIKWDHNADLMGCSWRLPGSKQELCRCVLLPLPLNPLSG